MIKTAVKAAMSAAKITEKYFNNLSHFESKDKKGKDLVSIADKLAEKKIKKIILDKYPSHGFWGEETGKENMNSEYIWVVDPIDGTSNYVHNIPLYSISIALLHKKKTILGVVYIPKTKELFYAEGNNGAYCNSKKICVSKETTLSETMGSIEYWSKDNEHITLGLRQFNKLAKKIKKIRYLSSTVFEICRVAKGDLDFALMDTTFLDIAAAQLILKNAGGKSIYLDKDKKENKINRILFSNQKLSKLIKENL